MNAADIIKSSLSMRDVSEQYGFSPNRSGNICCPFHSEKTPSLKIYSEPGRGFYCYGCGAGGSVIDFVIQLFGLSFVAACARLNYDFNLGISMDKPDPHTAAEFARKQRDKKQAREKLRLEITALCAEHRRLWSAYTNDAPKFGVSPSPAWLEAVHRREYIEYQIQELQKQEVLR